MLMLGLLSTYETSELYDIIQSYQLHVSLSHTGCNVYKKHWRQFYSLLL